MKNINVAILGSGNIACDVLAKAKNSKKLNPILMAGRNLSSPGLAFARQKKVKTSTNGIEEILKNISDIDILFDSTSANDHLIHKKLLSNKPVKIINLTPAESDISCIPAINLIDCINEKNISLISCGAQASIPIVYAIKQAEKSIDYLEVVSTISSKSAGLATRRNVSEYLESTESAIKKISDCSRVKTILNVSPATPYTNMNLTIYCKLKNPNIEEINFEISKIINQVKKYVPGYKMKNEPALINDNLIIMLEVTGKGDYLPSYAGNLDIITSAAVNVAENINLLNKE